MTVSDGYTLTLGEDVKNPSTKKAAWSFSGSTATYNSSYKTAGYTLASNGKSISYSKATTAETLATVNGVKSLDGLSLNKKVITVSKAALNKKNVTVSGEYEFNFASGDYKGKIINGSDHDEIIKTAGKYVTIISGKGADTISIGDSSKYVSIDAGAGNDSVKSTGSNISISGGAGDDTLVSTGSETTISGGADNDIITGGKGKDSLSGGDGKDTLSGGKGNDKLLGGAGNDSLNGGDGEDTLSGGTGENTLTGGKGADVFIYDGGNDVITDYSEEDRISIVSGTVSTVKTSGKNVIFTVKNGNATGKITVKGGNDGKFITYTDKKSLHTYPETFSFNKNGDGITLLKKYGKNSFDVADYGNDVVSINASAVTHNLTIHANKKNNRIDGGAGNDTIYGGKGNDTVDGGKGADIFVYNSGDGFDTILNYTEDDAVSIASGSVSNISTSKDKKDIIFTVKDGKTEGKITFKGASGKIVSYIDKKGNKLLYSNTVLISGKTATLTDKYNRKEFKSLDFGSAISTIDASAVEKGLSITGNGSNNSIIGGKGNDTIYGGRGDDTLKGGNGKDIFIYNESDGNDTILDYKQEDKIKIASGALSSAVTVKGDDVIFSVNSSKITVKNGKGTKITTVDSKGIETKKVYNSSTMIVADESPWFVQDDNNFDNAYNQLSAIVKGTASAYSFTENYDALSSVSSIPAISFSDKK